MPAPKDLSLLSRNFFRQYFYCQTNSRDGPAYAQKPSRADEMLTQALKSALALVEVRVLDHLIVAGGDILSFAERGLL
jgi:hypothetical protein